MVFKGICFALLFMTTTNITAQHYKNLSQEEKEQKSIILINEADAFILGTPVSERCFYGEDGKTIYTKIKIKVSHWYKGEGNRYVHIVLRGGIIGTDEQILLHNPGPTIQFDVEYFMLLNKKDENYEFVPGRASYGRYVNVYSDNPYIIAFYEVEFDSIEYLNEFVENLDGIRIPSKKKDVGFQKSLSSPDPIVIDNIWLASVGTLHAGVGEVLTIKGQNFGNKGDILFVNANNPGTDAAPNMSTKLENEYIVNWTPTEIQVIIPSLIREGFSNSFPGVAGSGKIVVVRRGLFNFITGQKQSTSKIYIEYGLLNFGTITNSTYNISQGYWAREHCLNGYVFTLHQSFMGNDPAINAAEAALSAWSEELGIILELEKILNDDGEEVLYFHNNTSEIKRNIIWFGDFSNNDQVTLMETRPYSVPDKTDNNNLGPDKNWIFNSNIKIREADNWNYSISGEINYAMEKDFYGVLLHEIGHALGIAHSIQLEAGLIDEKSLMHPFVRTSGIVSDDRTSLNQYGEEAKLATQKLATDSRGHAWSTEFSDSYGLETLAASGVNSTVLPTPSIDVVAQSFDDGTNRKLSPNPFDESNNYIYHWSFINEEADFIKRTVCRRGYKSETHHVRIKNDGCTVSSLYSLPETIGDDCRLGDEGDPIVLNNPLIIAYPNPTKGNFNIQFKPIEGEEIPEMENVYVGIYDNLGRLQHQHQVSNATLRQTTIDISTLPAGIYWVVWFADGEVIDTQQVQKTD